MNAGKLRHLVEILQPVDTDTTRGSIVTTYDETNVVKVWASIEPLQGKELLFAMQLRADLSHKITLRYNATLNHRVKLRWFNGTKYIEFHCGPAINKDMRNIEQSIYAVEIP